jgi:hypothetical protein
MNLISAEEPGKPQSIYGTTYMYIQCIAEALLALVSKLDADKIFDK